MDPNTERPLISFFLMAYNQEQFIREAVAGVFEQDYSPLEIILTDDCSTDRTYEIMCEMAAAYQGPHKIKLNQNSKNIGIIQHFNLSVSLSSGEMIIGAAGDDISTKQRTKRIFEEWQRLGGGVCTIFSDAFIIDENGHQTGLMCQGRTPKFATTAEDAVASGAVGVAGCSYAFSRQIIDKFGPIDLSVKADDTVIPFRSLLIGSIGFIDEPLIYYRIHGGNASINTAGRPSLEKRYLDREQHESVLLSWIHDVNIARKENLFSEEQVNEMTAGIYYHLYLCSIEKRTFRLNLWQAVVLIAQELLSARRLNNIIRIFERRRRSSR